MNMNSSAQPASATIKQTIPVMRGLLYAESVLVATIGISLYLMSDLTENFFAWTIGVPLTAAFLGASYWASFALQYFSARQPVWANARLAGPAVLTFSTLTLIVTLIHLDEFHLNAPMIIPKNLTWAWLGVYTSAPVVMSLAMVLQARAPGVDPQRGKMLPGWFRAILFGMSAVLVLMGIGLLVAPLALAPLWAWVLTSLTGRVVGAWLVGLGFAAGQTVWENDWARSFALMIGFTVFGVLQLIALLRYPDAAGLDWSSARAWVYVVFLLIIGSIGIYGAWMARRAATPEEGKS